MLRLAAEPNRLTERDRDCIGGTSFHTRLFDEEPRDDPVHAA
jgi:hypothetical protein